MTIEVNDRLAIPESELDWRFTPSGGPGGQHANRSSTRVELSWNVVASAAVSPAQRARLARSLGPIVRITVDDHRSQLRNRELAIERLVQRCRDALVVPKARRATKPSRNAKKRRVEAKRRTSKTKELRKKPKYDD